MASLILRSGQPGPGLIHLHRGMGMGNRWERFVNFSRRKQACRRGSCSPLGGCPLPLWQFEIIGLFEPPFCRAGRLIHLHTLNAAPASTPQCRQRHVKGPCPAPRRQRVCLGPFRMLLQLAHVQWGQILIVTTSAGTWADDTAGGSGSSAWPCANASQSTSPLQWGPGCFAGEHHGGAGSVRGGWGEPSAGTGSAKRGESHGLCPTGLAGDESVVRLVEAVGGSPSGHPFDRGLTPGFGGPATQRWRTPRTLSEGTLSVRVPGGRRR